MTAAVICTTEVAGRACLFCSGRHVISQRKICVLTLDMFWLVVKHKSLVPLLITTEHAKGLWVFN